jgi:hypothetical protein
MSESDASDTSSDTSNEIPDDLQQLWNEAIQECEQIERLHATILSDTAYLQESLSEDDSIMVTYQDVHQDFMDVLDSIHSIIIEDPNTDVGPMLLKMLESCEFKTSMSLLNKDVCRSFA